MVNLSYENWGYETNMLFPIILAKREKIQFPYVEPGSRVVTRIQGKKGCVRRDEI